MKKVFRTIVVLAVAAVAMSACKKEMQEAPVSNGIKVDFVAQSLDTKTEFGTASGSTIPVLWKAGDKVKVMVNVTEGGALEVTPSSDFKTGSFSAELPETFPYTVYALSPSSAFVSCANNSTYGDYIQYMISTSQTPPKGNVDPAAQVLLAKTEELTAAPEGKLSVNFKHLGAYGKLSLKNLNTNGKEVQSIALDFGTVGVAGRFIYEEADGNNHINEKSQAYAITINTSETENVLFGVGAVDISGATLKVTVTVSDGSYVKTITVPADKKFKEGVISSFSIDMSGAEFAKARTFRLLTNVSKLAVGDNVIITSAKNDYDTDNVKGHSVLSTQENTNNLQATCCEDCFIDNGATIYNPPTNVEILTLSEGALSGTWYLQSESKGTYLARKNSGKTSNYACFYTADQVAGDEKIAKSSSWSIAEEDSATHAMEMKSNCPLSGYDRVYFRTNIASTYIFSCYAAGKQDPVCIYVEDKTI